MSTMRTAIPVPCYPPPPSEREGYLLRRFDDLAREFDVLEKQSNALIARGQEMLDRALGWRQVFTPYYLWRWRRINAQGQVVIARMRAIEGEHKDILYALKRKAALASPASPRDNEGGRR